MEGQNKADSDTIASLRAQQAEAAVEAQARVQTAAQLQASKARDEEQIRQLMDRVDALDRALARKGETELTMEARLAQLEAALLEAEARKDRAVAEAADLRAQLNDVATARGAAAVGRRSTISSKRPRRPTGGGCWRRCSPAWAATGSPAAAR